MAASSSSSGRRTDDVFPSFRGDDVRHGFLSHLLKALDNKSIRTFRDNGIERSLQIGPELLSAIREAKISIVIFSKDYASSKWCLDELVEIHENYMRSCQKVIPIFYNVDPSEVRKQTGEFGKVFEETCKDKTEVQKQKWKQALTGVANLAGEHIKQGVYEAWIVEKIANDVARKLIISPSNYSDGLVGIEAHIEAMISRLCLKFEEVRMVGIVGPSGIGKSTIGRELYSQISRQFPYRIYETYRKINEDTCKMKLDWAKQFLSGILSQKDIEIRSLLEVEQRLKDKKVLIVLDDVDNLDLLETLVGKTRWFGPGSRIIVITQDKHLLEAHDIDLIYEVEFPSQTLALEMLCRSAFKQNSPPDGYMEVAIEVAVFAGNLPLGLSVLGSSLRKRSKDEWMEMLPRLQNILDGDIGKRLRVSYDRLNKEDQLLFLYIACHFDRWRVSEIQDCLGDSVNIGLRMLAEKSFIRIWSETVEMHDLLKKLGREIFLAESSDPGKRPFLVDIDDIRHVLTNNTGTDTVHGIIIHISLSNVTEKILLHENSFESMHNIQIINIRYYMGYYMEWKNESIFMDLPRGHIYLPRQLRVLHWDCYPAKCLPSTFKAEFLVRLTLRRSKLVILWEGSLPLRNLKVMDMSYSKYLEELPDLSKAINLYELHLRDCKSLVTLPSSILNLTKLFDLNTEGCEKLENFPEISLDISGCIRVKCCLWSRNLPRLVFLDCLMKVVPRQYRLQHIRCISVSNSMVEKLWEGAQSFENLKGIYLSECDYLKEIPDLSKATNLETLAFFQCKSLLIVPSTIGNCQKLGVLRIQHCTELKVLPSDVNLSALLELDFSGCSSLSMFPKISSNIQRLYLNETSIEGVPCFIENFSRLGVLNMCGCKRLKNISPNIFRLFLYCVDFADCGDVITILSDVNAVTTIDDNFSAMNIGEFSNFGRICDSVWWYYCKVSYSDRERYFNFSSCFKLNEDAREFILRSRFKRTILPGGEVPTYFKHRAYGNSLTIPLPQSLLSQDILHFKACVVFEASFVSKGLDLDVHYLFNGISNEGYSYGYMMSSCETDHLALYSFQFQPKNLPLGIYNMEFKFESSKRIKGCGVQHLNVSLSPDGSYETTYNQQFGDKCDVILETGGNK